MRYLLRRAVSTILTAIGMVVVVFFIVRILPGDPAILRAGPYASKESVAEISRQYGLSRPITAQFVDFWSRLLRGDLGTSMRTNVSVTPELLKRLPASLELSFYSLLIAVVVGIPLGVWAAVRQGGKMDRLVRLLAVLGSSTATFWLALVLIYLFFFRLQWFPGPLGRVPVGTTPPRNITGFFTIDGIIARDFSFVAESLWYLALPSFTLAFGLVAPIIKIVRAAMLETLRSDYVRTAFAMGLPRRSVLFVDAFRNALVPITTTLGIVFGYMLGGNIIVENIFSWPGMGRHAYLALQNNDLDVLQGFVIIIGLMYITLNFLIDIIYGLIDPRIKIGAKSPT